MSWHFSKALVQDYENSRFSRALEAAFSEAICLDGEPSSLWNTAPFAPDDLCSDRMKGTFHRSPFGTMYVPSTDAHCAALLMWFLEDFPARGIPPQLREETLQTISGRKCDGSWQMSLPGTYSPRTSKPKRSTKLPTTLRRWVTPSAASSSPRQTWVRTTFGSAIGYVHTPTCTANYAAPSMQKWACAREFVRVFGKPTPTNHEWLMGWPIGWTDSQPLETDKFQQWQQQHGGF